MQDDDMKKKNGDDDSREAAGDEEDMTGPANIQDPMSPHSIAPQIQDEEAEKADVAQKGAGAHPEPPIEELLEEDLSSTRDVNQLDNKEKG